MSFFRLSAVLFFSSIPFVIHWWQRHDWDNCNAYSRLIIWSKPIQTFFLFTQFSQRLGMFVFILIAICNDVEIISCSTSPDLYSDVTDNKRQNWDEKIELFLPIPIRIIIHNKYASWILHTVEYLLLWQYHFVFIGYVMLYMAGF